MFSFFKRKFGSAPAPAPETASTPAAPAAAPADASAQPVLPQDWAAPAASPAPAPVPAAPPPVAPVVVTAVPEPAPVAGPAPVPPARHDSAAERVPTPPAQAPVSTVASPAPTPAAAAPAPAPAPAPVAPAEPAPRRGWLDKLKSGLRKTGSSIAQVFTGTQIDDALYEELEAALLMADTGVKATEHLLQDLKRRVKDSRASDPAAVRALLTDALAELLQPLQKPLVVGEHTPTVMMVVGVNGAGKTTSIGKLTRHLADAEQNVLLAAADTFRAAAREQLSVWADRNRVQIVSQEGGDPSAVTYDAVVAGRSRGCDVVIADTAGRLPTQLHLMEELKKIKRVIGKAQEGAPHEVLLVVDGNTGQNALNQVRAFDDALGLTGLVVTKLDGTAKGGVLAAIARERPIPVYFIGVGEKLEDLQTFDAREFAQALLE